RRRPKWLTGVVFGSTERKGRWRLPRFALLMVLFGDADIDLRKAEIGGSIVTITAFVLFGNADFYVPTGVDVDLGGFTVFGHRGEHGEEADPAPDAPLVRIRTFSLFGTSDVVHADLVGAELERERARQHPERGLRRGVEREPRPRDVLVDGGDVHDRPAAVPAHVPRGGAGEEEHAADVDAEEEVEVARVE